MSTTRQAHEIYAVMEGSKLVMVVAKEPGRPNVTDITEDLARLLHHARSSPRDAAGKS